MAKDLSAQDGVDTTDSDYVNGKIVDGKTIIGEGINQDIVQFFQGLMSQGGVTASGDNDNETNGYQFITALGRLGWAYSGAYKGVQFPVNYVSSSIAAGSEIEITYPYDLAIQTAKFIGLVTYTADSTDSILEIDKISGSVKDLISGLELGDAQYFTVDAHTDHLTITLDQSILTNFCLSIFIVATAQ